MMDESEPWFSNGLRFKCTGCGKCCTGTGGSVYLSAADLLRLAAFSGMPPGRFARRYTRVVRGRRVLQSREATGDCVFLEGKGCSVYEGRPTQCRTYPWWQRNLGDEEAWREAAVVCEGIGHPAAVLVPAEEILANLALDEANDPSG